MISIIICSTKSDISDVLKENIQETVGVPYELVVIDNSKGEYSIFEAYNIGVERAKYPYICFIHEDIMFRSLDWGTILCKVFDDDDSIGLIGVVGTYMLPKLPQGWWYGAAVGSVVQSDRSKTMKKEPYVIEYEHIALNDAVACDGLFLSIPKRLFSSIKFDTETYNGFHCYDLDICMQVLDFGCRVVVVENVIIEHFSRGIYSKSLLSNLLQFNKKWQNKLPCASSNIQQDKLLEYNDSWLETLLYDRMYCFYNRHILDSRSFKYFVKIFNVTGKARKLLRKLF